MKLLSHWLWVGLLGLLLAQCKPEKLPYYGEPELIKKTVDGQLVEETRYPVIPPFRLINQDGQVLTERDLTGHIYVADFFFVTCPTICPVMKRNMKQVYEAFHDDPSVRILSHTIDPEHDTPAVLKQYATDLGLKGTMWQFVTGDRDAIYTLGEQHYLVTAGPDSTAPGGYIHSGHFILVDQERHVRGMYDGTTPEGTAQLIADIKRLQAE